MKCTVLISSPWVRTQVKIEFGMRSTSVLVIFEPEILIASASVYLRAHAFEITSDF